MALSKCRSCGGDISDSAPTCPKCGDKYPHGFGIASAQAMTPIIGTILAVVFLFWLMS